jgi:ketosteroid isomerase-like protein
MRTITTHVAPRRLFVLVAAIAALTFNSAPAAAQSAELARLLAKEQIEQVLLDYGRSLDARDFATYSSLFAADGEWQGGFGTVKGPANIKAFMEKNMGTGGNTTNNYHLMSNFVIKVNGDTATAWSRWAFVQPQQSGGATIAQAGRYDDTFVKENGVWKFKKRVASNDTGRPQGPQVRPLTAPGSEPSSK